MCKHCLRLGLCCDYDFRLTWQKASCPARSARVEVGVERAAALQVLGWMFLNTTYQDFDGLVDRDVAPLVREPEHLKYRGNLSPTSDSQLQCTLSPRSVPVGLSPVRMSSQEGRLWNYFESFITPQCAVSDGLNPYRDVVLRLAAHSPHGPLFRVIMAVAASQMHNLGHGGMEAACEARGIALGALRRRLASEHHTTEEIIITTVMMGFLEVSIPRLTEASKGISHIVMKIARSTVSNPHSPKRL